MDEISLLNEQARSGRAVRLNKYETPMLKGVASHGHAVACHLYKDP